MTKFYFAESQGLSGINLNTWKYNVGSIKFETKVLGLEYSIVLR